MTARHTPSSSLQGPRAYQTTSLLQVLVITVYFKDRATARLLMKIINVLGDHPIEQPAHFQFGKGSVGCIRRFAHQFTAKRPVEFPGLFRGPEENIKGCILIRFKNRPQSTWTSKIRNPATYGDTCSGKGNRFMCSCINSMDLQEKVGVCIRGNNDHRGPVI